MRTTAWMEYILDSQRCEGCGSSNLEIVKKTVSLDWRVNSEIEEISIYFVPLLSCNVCGHNHISSAVLGTLRTQFLNIEKKAPFDFKLYQLSLSKLRPEEQWVEENYFCSTDSIDCGFQIRTFQEEKNEDLTTKQTMEVKHG